MSEFNDSEKLIYGRMMMAASSMFEKLHPQQQIHMVERVANDLMKKIHGEQNSKKDSHILDVDAE